MQEITIELNPHEVELLRKYQERHPHRSQEEIITLALNAFLLEDLMQAFVTSKLTQAKQETK